ncbi:MAG: STAS domain-containing protein [Spirochaetota bacterium]
MYRLNYESLYIEVEMREVKSTSIQIVTFSGKFNHQNAYTISRNLQDLFKDEVYDLVLNLSDLKYINSVDLQF